MSNSQAPVDWQKVLAAFSFARPTVISSMGGTAASKVLIEDGPLRYVIRRRPRQFGTASYLSFDHDLNRLLTAEGFPVAPYLPSHDGHTWAVVDHEIFEATTFIYGTVEKKPNDRQLHNLGRQVARLHLIGTRFTHPDKEGFVREDHPSILLPLIEELEQLAADQSEHSAFEELRNTILATNERLTKRRERDWTVIHGDLHPGNVLFKGDEVIALFDFDYTARGMAIRDIGDCLLLIAGDRDSSFDPDDIWSLAQPCHLNEKRALSFLGGYTEVRSLPRDWKDLPLIMRSRWIQIRLRGTRKVPREEKTRFALAELSPTLEELDGFLPTTLSSHFAG